MTLPTPAAPDFLTPRLVKDIAPGLFGTNPDQLTSFRGQLYFTIRQGNTPGLWRSDGSDAGTVLVTADISGTVGAQLFDFTVYQNALYFSRLSGFMTEGLWSTDGSRTGTRQVRSVYRAIPLSPKVAGDLLFFIGDNGEQDVTWRSDGTAEGTFPLGQLAATDADVGFVEYNSLVYFVADDGIRGSELWRTDGTAAGTSLVADLKRGLAGSTPGQLTAAPHGLYFFADGDEGTGLYRVNAAGTVTFMKDLNVMDGVFLYQPVVANDILFFIREDQGGGLELWRSDGTKPGTRLALTLDQFGLKRAFDLTAVGHMLYFIGQPADSSKNDLWRTDGSALFTEQITAFSAATDDDPILLHLVGNRLFFTAQEPSNLVNCCRSLWYTDGTSSGTVKIRRTGPPDESAQGSPLAVVGEQVFFAATDETGGRELWTADLPPASPTTGGIRWYYPWISR